MFLIIAALFWLGMWFLVRGPLMADRVDADGEADPRIFCKIPPNCLVMVIDSPNTEKKQTGEGVTQATKANGGDVLKIMHTVPGHKVDDRSRNKNNWQIVPGRQRRGLFWYLFRVHYMGKNIFDWRVIGYSLREVRIREFRKVMDAESGMNKIVPKDYTTRFIHFSREHAVKIENAETKTGGRKLFATLIFLYQEIFHVRVHGETADPNTFLSTFGTMHFNGMVRAQEIEYYLYGGDEHQRELVEGIRDEVNKDAPGNVGIRVKTVLLDALDPDKESADLLALESKKELEGKAGLVEAKYAADQAAARADGEKRVLIATAQGQKEADILASEALLRAKLNENQGKADEIEKVILPLAREPGAARVMLAQALQTKMPDSVALGGDALSKLVGDGNIIQISR